jgi:hypothetical protein
MPIDKPIRRFHWLAVAALGALALIATAVPLAPAKAFFGVHVDGIGGHHRHYANYGRGHDHHYR